MVASDDLAAQGHGRPDRKEGGEGLGREIGATFRWGVVSGDLGRVDPEKSHSLVGA